MADALVSAEAFANTYEPKGYRSGWASVEAYRTWREWQADHPDAGRTAAGNALDMPPSRIRVWQNGGTPDAVRGLQTAQARDWVGTTLDEPAGEALIRLLAWVYSNGALPGAGSKTNITPRFSIQSADERRRLQHWAAQADVELNELIREGRMTEAEPATDGNILGRVFLAMGAVRGPASQTYEQLPWPIQRRGDTRPARWWTATYLRNRGNVNESRSRWVQFRETRSESYIRALARCFERATDAKVRHDSANVRLERRAVVAFLEEVDDLDGPEVAWGNVDVVG